MEFIQTRPRHVGSEPLLRENKALRRRSRKLEALLEISKAMMTETELDELLHLIMDRTTSIMEADRSTLWLCSEDGTRLEALIAQGAERFHISQPMGEGIAGTVAATGQSINVKDAYKDPRFDPTNDAKTGYVTRSILCQPMMDHDGRIMGVIQVLNKLYGHFTEEDEQLLAAIASQAAAAIEMTRLYEGLQQAFDSFFAAMSQAIDAKDAITEDHSARVRMYSVAIAKRLGLPQEQIEVIKRAASLHDLGKLTVPDAVWFKPGPLTPEEYKQVQQHVDQTAQILKRVRWVKGWEDIPHVAALHHERLDGSGYPTGAKGDEIPIGARIIAVADVFDAITSPRHYRDPMPVRDALDIIREGSGKAFDPQVVSAFCEYIEELIDLDDSGHGT